MPQTTYNGRCYCGAISWTAASSDVDFTSVCHCRVCQTLAGSAFGSTSLMIYKPDGVRFSGKEPKLFHDKSEQGSTTARGFCDNCGTVLFNHVSEGKPDEHWAMRTGCLVEGEPPLPQKEIFMKSKPSWVPTLLGGDKSFETMAK